MGTRSNRPRRRRRSFEEIQRLVVEFEASGLTRDGFAGRHGVSPSTVGRWVRLVGSETVASRPADDGVDRPVEFLELRMAPEESQATPMADGFELIFSGEGTQAPGPVELPVKSLRIGGGFDAEQLRRLLAVLVESRRPSDPLKVRR